MTKTILFRAGMALMFAAQLMAAGEARAQAYPAKPVTILVPTGAGGTSDIVARTLAGRLAELMGQSFVVENRAGAGGVVGTQAAAKSIPDGYTLMVTSPQHTIAPWVYRSVPYDPIRDFVPISPLVSVPTVLIMHPSLAPNNMKELIEYARSRPGQLRFGSAGNGTLNHLVGEMLNMMTGINTGHVPYKGIAAAVNDVLGGHVQMAYASLPSVLQNIRSGQLKALGVTTAQRASIAPEIPTIAEAVPGYAADLWIGLFAIARTPREITDRLHAETQKAMASPELRVKLAGLGADFISSSPEAFLQFLQDDLARWGKVVKATGAKLD